MLAEQPADNQVESPLLLMLLLTLFEDSDLADTAYPLLLIHHFSFEVPAAFAEEKLPLLLLAAHL